MESKKVNKKSCFFLLMIVILFGNLTGCNVGQVLQELATDFVQIELFNESGTLLAESDNNEQMYVYEINAEVINEYALPLENAVITLTAPENVELEEGYETVVKEKNISVGDEKEYSWIVKIPMIMEEQNIEYSVSVSSDVTNEVTAYGLLWIDGKNQKDNRLDFSRDTWKFENYSKSPMSITNEDYNAFMYGLSNRDREFVNEKIIKGSNGYCYGMAATSILVKMGRLSVDNIQKSAKNLHQIRKNKEAESLITCYFMTQDFRVVLDERAIFCAKPIEEKLAIIEEKAKNVETGGNPFIFSFYALPDEEGGHAVVAYAHEEGQFEWNGTVYDSRILIYDNNYPKWNEASCLYYNKGTGEWYIPNYPDSSDITRALDDLNLMDLKNIEAGRKSVNSYIIARESENLTVYAEDGGLIAEVDGVTVGNSESVVAFRNDGVDDEVTIAVPKGDVESAFVIESSGETSDLDIGVLYDNFYLNAVSEGQESVTFYPEGNISIAGESSDFQMEITADEGYYLTDWYKVSVSGDSGSNLRVELTDEGYILSGEDMKGIKIYAENNDSANELKLKTDEDKVYITQKDEKLCVMADEDEDGIYETVLKTGKKTIPENPLKGKTGTGIWLIIGGAVLVLIIVVIVIYTLRKKRRSRWVS